VSNFTRYENESILIFSVLYVLPALSCLNPLQSHSISLRPFQWCQTPLWRIFYQHMLRNSTNERETSFVRILLIDHIDDPNNFIKIAGFFCNFCFELFKEMVEYFSFHQDRSLLREFHTQNVVDRVEISIPS